jgi:ribosome-associated toxin RatA of RatAB toxin-antitoxin module
MATFMQSADTCYTPQQMFALVNDVSTYPRYVPLCRDVTLHARGPHTLKATIALRQGPLALAFTTLNRMDDGERIEMRLVDGPFSHLQGTWRFVPTAAGCRVSLSLEFDFSSRALSVALGPIFNKFAESFLDSFRREATARFGANAQKMLV